MFKNDAEFRDRLETASSAKARLVADFRAKVAAHNSPEFAQRQADRAAVGAARVIRQAAAMDRKKAEAALIESQREETRRLQQQAEEDRMAAEEMEKNKEKLAAIELKAKQKAGRDDKYAARQARREARAR
jgi:predicted TIM-barrel fold metal-dependent hydrolase